jgi:methylated-DNA-[protein]-cysteine S-methyltransferase
MAYATFQSPFGPLTLFADDGWLVALEWGTGRHPADTTGSIVDPLLKQAIGHLDRYFEGVPLPDHLPLRPAGTAYQTVVWRAIAAIPFAATRSYGELAHQLSTGPRAIARACASNPLPLLIPCHRVVAAGGRLGGYSTGDGVATKQALLDLEAVAVRRAG